MIIHVAGPTGSGKTTIGMYIIEKYPNILVKDLDDIHKDLPILFKNEFKKLEKDFFYEKYFPIGIKNYINKNENRTILFVGFNGTTRNNEIKYVDIPGKHKFYIDVPEEEILKRRFYRQIDRYYNNKEFYFNKTLNEKPLSIDFEKWREKINSNDLSYYRKRKYLFLNNKEIILDLERIFNK